MATAPTFFPPLLSLVGTDLVTAPPVQEGGSMALLQITEHSLRSIPVQLQTQCHKPES